MFSFLSKPLIGDLIIRVLDNDDKNRLKINDYILLSTSTKTRTSELKERIHGIARNIPIHRMLLLFSGRVLGNKSFIPIDCFELSDITDEDTLCFRVRLCLFILPRSENDQDSENSIKEEIIEIKKVEGEIAEHSIQRRRVRRKTKFQAEEFDLVQELETIQCEKFAAVLQRNGYDNEGAFANITLKELCGPGLWIPMNAAKRMIELAIIIMKRIENKDKKQMTIHMEIENDLIENKRIATVAIEGLQSQKVEGEFNMKQQEFTKKVDVLRAWKEEEFRKKYHNQHVKLANAISSRKDHSLALQAKINKIREYFAKVYEHENDKDFIEPARILYQIIPSASPQKKIENKRVKVVESLRSVTHDNKHVDELITTNHDAINNDTDLIDVSKSMNGKLNSSLTIANNDYLKYAYKNKFYEDSSTSLLFLRDPITCCTKHIKAISSNHEAYIMHRRLINTLELQVLLNRLQSTKSGYVKSQTLHSLAVQKLKSYHNIPMRSSDPVLISTSIEQSFLNLIEQRRIIKCVQYQEYSVENLFSILPVQWYNPKKFIDQLVDILEQLDRERLMNASEV